MFKCLKKLSIVILAIMSVCMISACGKETSSESQQTETTEENKDRVVLEEEKDATWTKMNKASIVAQGGNGFKDSNGKAVYALYFTVEYPVITGLEDYTSIKYTVENASGEFGMPVSTDKLTDYQKDTTDEYIQEASANNEFYYSVFYTTDSISDRNKWIENKIRELAPQIRLLAEVTKTDGTIEHHKYALVWATDYNNTNADLYEIIDGSGQL